MADGIGVRVNATGLFFDQANGSVGPCDSNQGVRVSDTVLPDTTRARVYLDSHAALNGRVEVLLPSRQFYPGIVTVFEVTTGAVLRRQSVAVSTVPGGSV